jgi:hypothetical protein
MIRDESRARFEAAVNGTRVRSWRPELALLAITYLIPPLHEDNWWAVWVAFPLFRYVVLRWVLLLVVWTVFAFRVARLPLRLYPNHPDLAGGLAFVSNAVDAFRPLFFALSAFIAGYILVGELGVSDLKSPGAAVLGLGAALIIAPQFLFFPRLDEAKNKGRSTYGTLSSHYIIDFERNWMTPAGKEMLGATEPIQGLDSSISNYGAIRGMHLIPLRRDSIFRLILIGAAPLIPVVIQQVGIDKIQLLGRLLMELLLGGPFP